MLELQEKKLLNAEDTEKVLNSLDKSGEEGVSLLRLSALTRIRTIELHSFIRSHRKLFDNGGTLAKIRIAQRAPIKGSSSSARRFLEEERAAARRRELLAYGTLALVILMSMINSFFAINS